MESKALAETEAFSAARSTHPRVTLDSMQAKIATEHYFIIGEALTALGHITHPATAILTVCVLVTTSGFTILGKSAPASPENFDPLKGQTFAYEDAIKQLWPLEGYLLRDKLHHDETAQVVHRDAGTGQFVTEADAAADPGGTTREKV